MCATPQRRARLPAVGAARTRLALASHRRLGIIDLVDTTPRIRKVDPRRVLPWNGKWQVVLAIEHANGVGGICRDESGSYWMSSNIEQGGGTGMTEGRASREGIPDGWALAGFLPPGATQVRVREEGGAWLTAIADQAAGVWMAFTRLDALAERFEDERGQIVGQPLAPEPVSREAVPDATTPCVACDSADWELVRFPIRYPGEEEEGPEAVVCRRCGHIVDMGMWITFSDDDVDRLSDEAYAEELAAARDAYWDEHVESSRRTFHQAKFPVYGIADWTGPRWWAGAGGSSSPDDDESTELLEVHEISLGFGPVNADGSPQIVVETSSGGYMEPDEDRLRTALSGLEMRAESSSDAWETLSHAALQVKMEFDRLKATDRADSVTPVRGVLSLDGAQREFLIGTTGSSSVGVTTFPLDPDAEVVRNISVTVRSENVHVDGLRLDRVTDIEPFLADPPW